MTISADRLPGRGADALFSDRSPAGPVLLVLFLLAAGAFFWEGVSALLTAWQLAEYSHGPLIPVLSGFLFLRQLRTVPANPGPVTDRWPGVLLIMAAIALGAVGKFARIDDIVAYAIILCVGGLILVSFGFRRGWQFWPGVLHLVFMLPLPGLLYYKVSTNLQFISSELGVWFVQLAGIPVILDGNIIDLGTYKLHVAEACSGLRYLFPIMSFSYVFATLYKGPVWHKAVLLLSAAPITVLMNSVRIGVVGVMVDSFGIEHAEGLSHFLEGWVIFITCVIILFALARLMLAMQRSPMTLQDALDLEFDGVRPQLARVRDVRASSALIASTAVIGAAAVAWAVLPDRAEAEIRREALVFMPDRLGEWKIRSSDLLAPETLRVLAADDYFAAKYASPDAAAPVDLFVAWYADQTRGGIHSPEVCLPGAGWEMERIEQIDAGARLGAEGAFPVNRAVIQKGLSRLMVYYWFDQYGGRVASDYRAKINLLVDAVVHGRSDGALVRAITPILPGETDAEAEARLVDFVTPLVEVLPYHVPSHAHASRAVR